MLTLEAEEELPEGLRRTLVALLHVTSSQHGSLREVQDPGPSFAPLAEVKSTFEGLDPAHAAVRVSVPPLLRRERLREVLGACVEDLLGEAVPFSLRIATELAETVRVAEELAGEEGEGTPVLCFAQEEAVGEPDFRLLDLREALQSRTEDPVRDTFPLNHFDVLCRWDGAGDPVVWGPEPVMARAYQELVGTEVGITVRGLADAASFLSFLEDEDLTSG